MGCTQPGLHACALPGRLPARKRKKKDRKAEERELSGRGRREPWGRICGQHRGALVRGLRLRLPVSPASRPSALSPTGRAPPAAPAQLSRRPRSVGRHRDVRSGFSSRDGFHTAPHGDGAKRGSRPFFAFATFIRVRSLKQASFPSRACRSCEGGDFALPATL